MLQRSKQSVLVGLTAGLLLAGAGAYAISLNGIRQPVSSDLPVITFTRLAQAVAPAPATPPAEPSAATTEPAVLEPTDSPVTSTAVRATPKREVIAPEVREEDGDDHDSSDSSSSKETSPAAKPADGESSGEQVPEEHHD
ncbi:MAG: hypothetical protein CVT59_06820 [Actinobacteria bacterium HGW-Actinobacteria-1]|jgi:hypothetical protein|nr:MAG: hypothetical protein CVT59_06820 [Actinobacteria bacterium HGW-Actinobacteria-1]